MKATGFIFLFILYSLTVNAARVNVSTASAINAGNWRAGDTIIMKNGIWNNQTISLTATGNSANPVVLLAETAGSVILNGTSRISVGGNYVVVSGLYFLNGNLATNPIIEFRTNVAANNCTLKNTAIINCNPINNTTDTSKWVSVYGQNNTVEHCSFENKTNMGTLLVVWLTSGTSANHTISNNYFGHRNPILDVNGKELNGQEIIRIGDSGTSMTTANVTLSGNFFEKCNGEMEIVSNKSCGNVYTNNLFLECKGALTLRHGNGCTVNGNYFFGNNVAECGGVRIIGENHKVYNNYFEKLKGTDYRAALCIVRGKENSTLNEYFQVKNTMVAFNTMVDCTEAFNINYNTSSTCSLPPIGTTIAHNHVYNSGTSNYNVIVDQTNVAAIGITWKNNLMNQGKYTDFSYKSTQVVTGKDAKMALTTTSIGMYEPGAGSTLLNYVTTEYSDVLLDIRGRSRGTTAKVPGASQISGSISKTMPAKNNVGAAFLYNTSTGIEAVLQQPLDLSLSNKKIRIKTLISGQLSVSNISGQIISQKNLVNEPYTSQTLSNGLYIVNLIGLSGDKKTSKILVQ
ncbi:MAG: polysaccharide lyase 6 family protein [Paludibacter sp.]